MYKISEGKNMFFLVHPGGPFFKNKDEGFWSIPKGIIEENEEPMKTAIREFKEETGLIPEGPYMPLGTIRQKSGKLIYAWAFKCNYHNIPPIKSNSFEMEWPPRSGKKKSFPEIDKAEFFTASTAKEKIIRAQSQFIVNLEKKENAQS